MCAGIIYAFVAFGYYSLFLLQNNDVYASSKELCSIRLQRATLLMFACRLILLLITFGRQHHNYQCFNAQESAWKTKSVSVNPILQMGSGFLKY